MPGYPPRLNPGLHAIGKTAVARGCTVREPGFSIPGGNHGPAPPRRCLALGAHLPERFAARCPTCSLRRQASVTVAKLPRRSHRLGRLTVFASQSRLCERSRTRRTEGTPTASRRTASGRHQFTCLRTARSSLAAESTSSRRSLSESGCSSARSATSRSGPSAWTTIAPAGFALARARGVRR